MKNNGNIKLYVNSHCFLSFLLRLANRLKDRTESQLSIGNKFSISVKVWFFYRSGCILWIPWCSKWVTTIYEQPLPQRPVFIWTACLLFLSLLLQARIPAHNINQSSIFNFHRLPLPFTIVSTICIFLACPYKEVRTQDFSAQCYRIQWYGSLVISADARYWRCPLNTRITARL